MWVKSLFLTLPLCLQFLHRLPAGCPGLFSTTCSLVPRRLLWLQLESLREHQSYVAGSVPWLSAISLQALCCTMLSWIANQSNSCRKIVCVCIYIMCIYIHVCMYIYVCGVWRGGVYIMHLNTHRGTHTQLYPTIPDWSPRCCLETLTYESSYFKNTNKSSRSRRLVLYVKFIVLQVYSITIVAANPLGYTFPSVMFMQCSRF